MYPPEKGQVQPNSVQEVAPDTQYRSAKDGAGVERVMSERLERMKTQDKTMKRTVRYVNLITRVLAVILSGWMLGAESFSLYKFETTRNIMLANGQAPWPNPAVLWPTYLVIAMSAISFVFSFVSIVALMCMSKEKRERSDKAISYASYTMTVGFVIVWAVTTGLFQMANTGNDLWGWSCGGSDAIQNEVQSFLNFGTLCLIQGGSWDTMIIHTCVYAATLVAYILIAYRYMRKRQMKKLETTISAHTF